MKKSIMWAVVLGTVLGMSAAASAATVRITFNGTDGVSSSLWDGTNGTLTQETFGGSNTGADAAHRAYLTLPRENDGYPVALYRANLPADFAGAIVNSATFLVRDANFNGGGPTTNIQARRVNVPGAAVTWDPGTGTRGTRFSPPHNGAQMFWSNFNVANNNGIDWAGNPQNGPWNGGSATDFRNTALADLLATGTLDGNGTQASFDVTLLAQNWASGTWENDGFALSTLNAVGNTNGYQIDTSGGSRGLTLDYTPVPEPASLALLALGGLALLARRSRYV